MNEREVLVQAASLVNRYLFAKTDQEALAAWIDLERGLKALRRRVQASRT